MFKNYTHYFIRQGLFLVLHLTGREGHGEWGEGFYSMMLGGERGERASDLIGKV